MMSFFSGLANLPLLYGIVAQHGTLPAVPLRRTAPKDLGQQDYDEGPDEDIYISNVQALRQDLARQHGDYRHNITAQRVAHFDKEMKDLQRKIKAQQEVKALLREHSAVSQIVAN